MNYDPERWFKILSSELPDTGRSVMAPILQSAEYRRTFEELLDPARRRIYARLS
jgi:hypothetical protein